MPLAPNTLLGSHQILSPLGAGGMGEVYRARDRRLERDVAIKLLPPELAEHPERLARFEREAKAVAALNHPNIVTLHSIEEAEGIRFLTMELVDGETLSALLDPNGLPVSRVLELAIPLADALAAAHDKGVVHRDLKPANVMLTRDGRIKVMDFGLAKLLSAESDAALTQMATVETPLSGAGLVLGTVPYMAPEQIRGGAVDGRADVFSMGVLLFELLTGRRPFEGHTAADVMSAILRHEPTSLLSLRPDAPVHLGRIVRRCLAKDAERRIQTSKDVRNELEELRRELESGVTPDGVAETSTLEPVEKRLLLTSAQVRQLSERNPRLIGYPVHYLDNRRASETLVVCLPAMGGDHRWFDGVVRVTPYRTVSISLLGFAPDDAQRPSLGLDDHSQVLRMAMRELVREIRPRTTILVGHSIGSDQFFRMNLQPEGLGIDVAGLLAFGTNLCLDTAFVSRLYVHLKAGDPGSVLEILKNLAQNTHGLAIWLAVQGYIAQTFTKFGADVEPLRRYAADALAAFENGGDPFPGWYRGARERIGCVRVVFSQQEREPAEELLARHLDQNILGDAFTDQSFAIEPVHHIDLIRPDLVSKHLEALLDEVAAARGVPRARGRS